MVTFEALIAGKPASVQATAHAARAYVRSLGADVTERCESGKAVYLRGQHPICTLAIDNAAAHIRLIADLQGSDAGRGQRSIALRIPTDLTSATRALVRAAYEAARR